MGKMITKKVSRGEVIEFPDSACVIIETNSKEILLVRQFRMVPEVFTLELPGGVVELGETPQKAAMREVFEETGLVIDHLSLVFSLDLDFSVSKHITHVFSTIITEDLSKTLSSQILYIISLREAIVMIEKGSITHAPTVAAIYWLSSHTSSESQDVS